MYRADLSHHSSLQSLSVLIQGVWAQSGILVCWADSTGLKGYNISTFVFPPPRSHPLPALLYWFQSGIQGTVASDGELYTQSGKELSPKKRSKREKKKKMLFRWKNGSRDLPRERMDVSPADWERQCGLGMSYQIEVMEDRACKDKGK